jgi:hypothetical protein
MDADNPQGASATSLDFAGFAWEFLRRRPAYRSDYQSLVEASEAPEATQQRLQERWGLVFPARP